MLLLFLKIRFLSSPKRKSAISASFHSLFVRLDKVFFFPFCQNRLLPILYLLLICFCSHSVVGNVECILDYCHVLFFCLSLNNFRISLDRRKTNVHMIFLHLLKFQIISMYLGSSNMFQLIFDCVFM